MAANEELVEAVAQATRKPTEPPSRSSTRPLGTVTTVRRGTDASRCPELGMCGTGL